MDKLVRAAVFGDGPEKEHARWLIWEIGQAVGVSRASIHESVHGARPRRVRTASRCRRSTCAAMAYDTARVDLPHGDRQEGGRVHPRDRALRDRLHRSAPRRIRRGDARRGAARRIPRPGVHSGRPLPGERQEVRGRPDARSGRGEGAGPRGDRGRVLQHRHRHVDAGRSLQADARRAAAAQLRSRRSTFDGRARARADGVTISLGGEIGEVGTQNSTVDELRAYMDGFNRSLPTGHGRAFEDQRAVRHVARRRGAARRLDRRREARSRHARDAVEGGARRLRARGRGAARRVDAAGYRVQQLPEARDGRDPSRDELPEHAVRSHAGRAARRDLRVARRERQGRAQADRLRRAVLSTRRAKRRSVRSSGSSGICPSRDVPRSTPRTTRSSVSCSTSWRLAIRRRWSRAS